MTLNKVVWHGKQVSAREKIGAERGLRKWAEHVLEGATKEVPVAPSGGTLQDSGVTDVDPARMEATVSYGTPYAVVQHENLTYHHSKPGAKAKYLEDPLNASRAEGLKILAENIRGAHE